MRRPKVAKQLRCVFRWCWDSNCLGMKAVAMDMAMAASMAIAIGTSARTSETSAITSETSARTNETNARTRETSARTNETNEVLPRHYLKMHANCCTNWTQVRPNDKPRPANCIKPVSYTHLTLPTIYSV